MKGETSLPYFAPADDQFGRRRTFDVAVQFGFQKHSSSLVIAPRPSAAEHRALDNSAAAFRSAMVPPILRRFTKMSEQRTTAAGGMETSYGFRERRRRREAVAGQRRLPQGRQPLRPDERPDVGRLHRLWKDGAGGLAQSAEAAGLAGARRRRRHRRHRLPHRRGVAAATPMPPCSTSTARCSPSAASAPRRRGLPATSISSRPMPRNCPSPTIRFDAYTIAFGIRNVPRIEAALAEAFRVLKPGGRFLCLEFSEVDMPLLDQVYEAWSFNAIPQHRPDR